MTIPASFNTLLAMMQDAHNATPALRDFCAFPNDVREMPFAPYTINAAQVMSADQRLCATTPLAQAILCAGQDAHWRETYKHTNIGADFLSRFGCFAIIGPNAPWVSDQMAAFMVYMPAGLWYPFHEHPAEELYYIVAGSAEFALKGKEPQLLRPGNFVYHASGESHATRTTTEPLLAYVLWRNHLDTPPVLSDPVVEKAHA